MTIEVSVTSPTIQIRTAAATTAWSAQQIRDLGGMLGRGLVAKSAEYLVVEADRGKTISCSGTFDVDLPSAATVGIGWMVAIFAASGTITVDGNGTETIRTPAGSAETAVITQGQAIVLQSDGTNWVTCASSGLPSAPTATVTAAAFIGGSFDGTSASGIVTRQAATQDAVALLGRAGGTDSRSATITTATLTASRTATLPDADITVAGINLAQTWTAAQNFGTVGNTMGGGTYSADDSILLLRRESTAVPDSHAVRDETVYTVASGGGGYASFDAVAEYAGASAFNHLHAFQSRPSYTGSGSLTDLVGFWSQEDHDGAATVTNRRGVWIKDPTGAGTITTNYGVHVEDQTRGATNYAIYTGAGLVRLGGAVTLASATAGTPTLNATASVAGDHGLTVRNTNAGTGSYAYLSFRNDQTASCIFQSFSSGYTGTIFGITAANYVGLNAFGASNQGMLIGLSVDKPLVFGVNNAEKARITSSAVTLASGINLALSGAATLTTGTGTTTVSGGMAVTGAAVFTNRFTLNGNPSNTEAATPTAQSRILATTGDVGADIYPGTLGNIVFAPRNNAARVVAIWNGNPLTMVSEWSTTAMTMGPDMNIAMPSGVATTATTGFFYAPSCAGTPTGTPAAISNGIPMVVDRTNHKLYFYSGGAWRDAGP